MPAVMACRHHSASSIRPTSRLIPRPASAAGPRRHLHARCTKASRAMARISFPAFPFDHFTKVTDEDVKALYAYFMTRPPVRATPQSRRRTFPAQHPSASGRVEAPLRYGRALSAGYHEECRMESRRLSRRGAEPLWRVSHASQSSWSREVFPSLCRCRDRRLDRTCPDGRKPGAGALVASRSLQLSAQRIERCARYRGGLDVSRGA